MHGIGLTKENQKELVHGYFACVTYTDHNVGFYWMKLEKVNNANEYRDVYQDLYKKMLEFFV